MNKNVILRKVKLDTELDKNILILRKQRCVNSFFFCSYFKRVSINIKEKEERKKSSQKMDRCNNAMHSEYTEPFRGRNPRRSVD